MERHCIDELWRGCGDGKMWSKANLWRKPERETWGEEKQNEERKGRCAKFVIVKRRAQKNCGRIGREEETCF